MTLQNARVSTSNGLGSSDFPASKKIGWVHDIILNEDNVYAKSKKFGSSVIGSIRFRTSDNLSPSNPELPVAHPFDKNFKNLPIINEQVEIYEFSPGSYAYRRIGNEPNPMQSAPQAAIANFFAPDKNKEQDGKKYQDVIDTGIATSNEPSGDKYKKSGDYYVAQRGIHKLKLYEGDSLFESRFGQSIRFSAYNNLSGPMKAVGGTGISLPTPIFAPTLIIRNGESSFNTKKPYLESVVEDINRDGSSIVLSSGDYVSPFIPGTVNDDGKSNFQTKPESFSDYPTKLVGDQILINSGRIIFSAKNAEMIFFSKKNYGFISDGGMSIDNKLGIDVSVGDNIDVITNDKNISLRTGKGNIFLGDVDLEPIVKGQQLVELLGRLLDAIVAQQYLTPSGPTKIGPENVPTFSAIKQDLNNILSKLNQTS
jgi:hypothetical protein